MVGTTVGRAARRVAVVTAMVVGASLVTATAPASSGGGRLVTPVVERTSVASDGSQSASESREPAISGDGRFVAFESPAADLVADDTNGFVDIFVHDRETGITERVSVADDGTEANADSHSASLSADGRYVAFQSDAWNLTPSDNNEKTDVFVYDRLDDTIALVSRSQSGKAASNHSGNPVISADGTHVAFDSLAPKLVDGETDDNLVSDVFVVDLTTSAVERVSVGPGGVQADGPSFAPDLSADGNEVAFESSATNLVVDDTNVLADVFVRDRAGATTERVSVSALGDEADAEAVIASIDDAGRHVAFSSEATTLVPTDANGTEDVFVHDRTTGDLALASVATDGEQADLPSSFPELSGDGTSIAFTSRATNLVPVDTNNSEDVFVRDLVRGETRRGVVGDEGQQPDFRSYESALSTDGSTLVFDSVARNLLADDTNFRRDVFVVDLTACLSGFLDVGFEHPFCREILWLGGSGITGGYADGGFHPSDQVTRQATAAFLYRYDGSPPFAAPVPPTFGDVGTTHPFRTPIEWAADAGVTGGYADGGFHPASKVTRQAFAAFLARYASPSFTPPGTATFNDVAPSHPFYEQIEWLASTGITGGYADGGFHPTAVITRQAIAAFLFRYHELPAP